MCRQKTTRSQKGGECVKDCDAWIADQKDPEDRDAKRETRNGISLPEQLLISMIFSNPGTGMRFKHGMA